MSSLIKRPSQLRKKKEETKNIHVPSFKSRKTLSQIVKDNMKALGKQGYTLRIIYIAYLNEPRDPKEMALELKESSHNIEKHFSIQVTGIFLLYSMYLVAQLDGSNATISIFMNEFFLMKKELFQGSRLITLYNHTNQVNSVNVINFSIKLNETIVNLIVEF